MLSMDKNEIPINVFIDLSKAFDTLDYDILLTKLCYYGINGTSLELMKSYLSNREQYVEIDDTKSEIVSIHTGVPQGSILGPLLFIIYMNDIYQSSDLLDFIIYADDTTLSGTLQVISKDCINYSRCINEELDKVCTWLKLNKLSLNTSKTKYMIFHTPQRKIEELELSIDGMLLERVKSFNFLGITINEHLKWGDHIDKISNKISRNIGILNNVKNFLPEKIKLTIYNSLILSHINYGLILWGHKSCKCDRILKLQKRAVRLIKCAKYNAHTEPLFKQLSLLRIDHLLKQQELKFYFKYRNNLLPVYLQNIPLFHINEIHLHDTRAGKEIRHPLVKHEYAKKSIRYTIPVTVNETPLCILDKIDTHCIQGFSKYIKMKYVNSYKENCEIRDCYTCNSNS